MSQSNSDILRDASGDDELEVRSHSNSGEGFAGVYEGLKRLIRSTRRRVKRQIFLSGQGVRGRLNRRYCTICDRAVWFTETGPWLRDQHLCSRCGSIPRNRAIVRVLNDHFPRWRELWIYESSPGGPSSDKIKRECKRYVASQFFPEVPGGQFKDGQRSEDLEALTFQDESFDLVITQDVFEHVLQPAKAFPEIARTRRRTRTHGALLSRKKDSRTSRT